MIIFLTCSSTNIQIQGTFLERFSVKPYKVKGKKRTMSAIKQVGVNKYQHFVSTKKITYKENISTCNTAI